MIDQLTAALRNLDRHDETGKEIFLHRAMVQALIACAVSLDNLCELQAQAMVDMRARRGAEIASYRAFQEYLKEA